MSTTLDHPSIAALAAALRDAADALRIPATEIEVASLEAREWPDGCLGLPGEGCTDAITPGYRVVLGSPADGFVYRTDRQGTVRHEPTGTSETGDLIVAFERSGGLVGRPVAFDLDTATMPAPEANELRRLVDAADFWNLPGQIYNGEPVADGFAHAVAIRVGRRRHSVATYDGTVDGLARFPGFAALLGWLSARTPIVALGTEAAAGR